MGKEFDAASCRLWIENNIDIDFFRIISEPVRSELLIYLASSGEMTIGEIAEKFPQNRSVISRHLDYLNRLGAVNRRKQGREVYYRSNNKLIVEKFEKATLNMKAVMEK